VQKNFTFSGRWNERFCEPEMLRAEFSFRDLIEYELTIFLAHRDAPRPTPADSLFC
jgi:hypothetical protein